MHFSLYSTVNVFLMIQSLLGNSVAMYVVYDMFQVCYTQLLIFFPK